MRERQKMTVEEIDTSNGDWSPSMPETAWIRLRVGDSWYDVQPDGDAIRVRTEHQMLVLPDASNGVRILSKNPFRAPTTDEET